MSRGGFNQRPTFFGHVVGDPYGPVRNVPRDTVVNADDPLHEQLGPAEPEADSLRDWFIERTQDPLDEGRGTPLVGLWNAYVYRYIHPEIRSHHMLAVKASSDPELCRRFGMEPGDTLSQSQLARAYWKRIDRENRRHLRLDAASEAVDAAKAGFEVNPDAARLVAHHLPESMCHYPDVDPEVEDETVEVPEEQKARAAEEVKDFLNRLDLSRPAKGTKFDDGELLEVWKRASIEGRFVEGTSDTYDEHDTRSNYRAPCGETVRKPVRELEVSDDDLVDGDIDKTVIDRANAENRVRGNKWSERIDELNFDLIEEAQSYGMFDRPVTLYVDGSAIPHRPQSGNPAPDSCVKNRSSEESVWCYEHVTISAVDCRRSIKLGSLLMRDHGKQADLVMELLQQARKYVNIGWVIWDAGFDKGDLISFCNHHNIRFCSRKKRGGNVVERVTEETANEEGTTALERDYEYTSGAVCDLFAVQRGEINLANVSSDTTKQAALTDFDPDAETDDDEEWILWATNSDSLNAENIMAHGMLYRVRWSIETAYRVIKEHFKASTTSLSDAIRIFVWKLALLFYNAWALLRILLKEKGVVVKPGETEVRTHSFQRYLTTEYG